MKLHRLFGLALFASGLVLFACSSDDEEETGSSGAGVQGDCDDIIDACHHKDDPDVTGDTVSQCHDMAHEATDQAGFDSCRSMKADCVAACEASDYEGEHHSGGTGGHSGGSGGMHSGGAGGEHAGGAAGSSQMQAGGSAGEAGGGW